MKRTTGMRAISGIALAAVGACSSSHGPSAARCQPATPDAQITIPIAPSSQRVDLATPPPTFSNPTSITNPIFPVSAVSQTILVGTKDGLPFRAEYTLLPETRTLASGLATDQEAAVRTVHYLAYLDGRINELALDWYAQDDDGSVWYFGEDVFNYENGVVANMEGTWLACKDGPAAMIMPADPQVGNVWRPENIFGLVFEEVTVAAINQTLPGPRGPVAGVVVTSQLYQDGTREDKLFAPGYGEFSTGSPGADLEALALAVGTDALAEPTPGELETVLTGASAIFDQARAGDWAGASTAMNQITAAWNTYRVGGVPPLLEPLMTAALGRKPASISSCGIGRSPRSTSPASTCGPVSSSWTSVPGTPAASRATSPSSSRSGIAWPTPWAAPRPVASMPTSPTSGPEPAGEISLLSGLPPAASGNV